MRVAHNVYVNSCLKLQILLKSLNQVSSAGNNSGNKDIYSWQMSLEPQWNLTDVYMWTQQCLKSQEYIKNKLSGSTEN